MSSRPEQKNACSAAPSGKKRPYDNRPRPAQERARRRAPREADAVRVVMPDEPPQLNPEAARVLLRILLKAYDRLNSADDPQEGAG